MSPATVSRRYSWIFLFTASVCGSRSRRLTRLSAFFAMQLFGRTLLRWRSLPLSRFDEISLRLSNGRGECLRRWILSHWICSILHFFSADLRWFHRASAVVINGLQEDFDRYHRGSPVKVGFDQRAACLCSDLRCYHGRCLRYSNDPQSLCQCWSGRFCQIASECRCSSNVVCLSVDAFHRSICLNGGTCLASDKDVLDE